MSTKTKVVAGKDKYRAIRAWTKEEIQAMAGTRGGLIESAYKKYFAFREQELLREIHKITLIDTDMALFWLGGIQNRLGEGVLFLDLPEKANELWNEKHKKKKTSS